MPHLPGQPPPAHTHTPYFFSGCFPVNARCANQKQNYNLCLIGRRSVFFKVLLLTSTHLTNDFLKYYNQSIHRGRTSLFLTSLDKNGDTTSELRYNDTVFKIKLLLMDTVTLEITCRRSSYACIRSASVNPLTPAGLDRNCAPLL